MAMGIVDYGLKKAWHHPDEDTVIVTNEDLGVTATLAAGVNDNVVTTIPFPSEWDPDTETCVVLSITGHLDNQQHALDDFFAGYLTTLSMVDRSPTATYRGGAADATDEWRKAQFTPQMWAGVTKGYPSGTAAGASYLVAHFGSANTASWRFIPKKPIPMFYPIYATIIGNNVSLAGTTGNDTNADFAQFEQIVWEYDYYIRGMTPAEKAVFTGPSGYQMRLAHLGS